MSAAIELAPGADRYVTMDVAAAIFRWVGGSPEALVVEAVARGWAFDDAAGEWVTLRGARYIARHLGLALAADDCDHRPGPRLVEGERPGLAAWARGGGGE